MHYYYHFYEKFHGHIRLKVFFTYYDVFRIHYDMMMRIHKSPLKGDVLETKILLGDTDNTDDGNDELLCFNFLKRYHFKIPIMCYG